MILRTGSGWAVLPHVVPVKTGIHWVWVPACVRKAGDWRGSPVFLLRQAQDERPPHALANRGTYLGVGLTAFAAPPIEESSTDAKIDRLTIKVEATNRRLEASGQQEAPVSYRNAI